jgi:aryl-alcohol dehydrogenase-like predicted oxidoreductase
VVGLALRPNFRNSYPPRPGSSREDDSTTSSSTSSYKSNINNINNNNNRDDAVKKIEFVNFWGSKVTLDESPDAFQRKYPRTVPCVPSLDPLDGPLPNGAFVEEGNAEYDAKASCRISVAVNWGPNNNHNHNNNNNNSNSRKTAQTTTTICDPNDIVRRLQSCVESGLTTFQLYDQDSQGLDIVARMKQQTPSYVESHWSINLVVPTICNSIQDTRASVVRLLEQTKGDAIDSLHLEYNPQSPYTLDILDHLAELQREGYIRSIGVRHMPSSVMKDAIIDANFGRIIDFQQQSGNLLLPPQKEFCYPGINLWMSNPLASGLLTDLYMSTMQSSLLSSSRSSGISRQDRPVPLLSTQAGRLLREWATLKERPTVGTKNRESQFSTSSSPVSSFSSSSSSSSGSSVSSAWSLYQTQVVQQLQWIALKHQVSISAVALRWALECGTSGIQQRRSVNNYNNNNKRNKTRSNDYSNNNSNGRTYYPTSSSSVASTTNRDYDPSTSSSSGGGSGIPPMVVSSTVVDCAFDTELFEPQLYLRQVFRFELDEEDKELLKGCSTILGRNLSSSSSANTAGTQRKGWNDGRRMYQDEGQSDEVEESEGMDEEDYPDIDFSNRALWL